MLQKQASFKTVKLDLVNKVTESIEADRQRTGGLVSSSVAVVGSTKQMVSGVRSNSAFREGVMLFWDLVGFSSVDDINWIARQHAMEFGETYKVPNEDAQEKSEAERDQKAEETLVRMKALSREVPSEQMQTFGIIQ